MSQTTKEGHGGKPRRRAKVRVMVFISGGGTNLQVIIDAAAAGRLPADLVGVLSNRPEAFGLIRAQRSGVETKVVPSQGTLKVPKRRKEVEAEFLNYVVRRRPEVIVLAGFMMILSDDFLKELQKRGITLINLHPALLPDDGGEKVKTSLCTKIPALRGAGVIQKAYELGLPVSGVTVHQILPNLPVDVGPIILRQEVRREAKETKESWEKKIHSVEHRLLPTALKRVINLINQGVDVSRGYSGG